MPENNNVMDEQTAPNKLRYSLGVKSFLKRP